VILLCFSSCKKWEKQELQVPEYTGKKANKTIADIKARHTELNMNITDSICQYSGERFIVKAMVVSSDEGGNCYKYITIQDQTGGIEIAIDQSSLFNEYPVGQIVYLNCGGLVVGDYYNKYQVGWIYENSIGRINYMLLNRYLSKEGLPSLDNIKDFSPCGGICEINSDADLSNDKVNCLCTIKKARFSSSCHGLRLATNEVTCDRALENYSVVVRTSNYAKFRNIVIDATKEYDLTGILTIYKSDYQFTLRTADDIKEVQEEPQPTEVLVYKEAINANSLSSGSWTQTTPDAWKFQSADGDDFLYHLASQNTCDDWLISPEIAITEADCILKLEHQISDVTNPDYYQVYYSTTYQGGEINLDDWTPYTLSVYPPNFSNSNALTPVPQGTFRIGIRYNKSNVTPASHRWCVKALNFYKTEWR
jgi:hypothetical protein